MLKLWHRVISSTYCPYRVLYVDASSKERMAAITVTNIPKGIHLLRRNIAQYKTSSVATLWHHIEENLEWRYPCDITK